jgi:hypothetical protein
MNRNSSVGSGGAIDFATQGAVPELATWLSHRIPAGEMDQFLIWPSLHKKPVLKINFIFLL